MKEKKCFNFITILQGDSGDVEQKLWTLSSDNYEIVCNKEKKKKRLFPKKREEKY